MNLGKTAIAAYLARYKASIIAYHFANPVDHGRTDARRVILSLSYQVRHTAVSSAHQPS
jgi:hypothetical protein